ncbi:hypothetical protein GGX14DRAFT_673036 [Mycena pura]|uniref:C2H2-type domain-containing protein n=1 Tax=Mycena pura TaxID=153505 RepID=A0AAD6UWB6_9AGAR|nr:hypothetical protein GGX14DRAFT_673036 [Mycena pura]
MHQCEVCSKEFSRPSGLRTHMNMHSHAQPYKCQFPACHKSFSVLSNARRHYRTHGEELPSSLPQYQVNFDVPVTAPRTAPPPPLSLSQVPFRVRWVGPNLRTRTHQAQPPDVNADACDDDRWVSDEDHDTNSQGSRP